MSQDTQEVSDTTEVDTSDVLLETRGLSKYFPIKKGMWGRTVGHVKAVDQVDLQVKQGQTVGLVGESGCGKSTLGRTILRAYEPTAGEIRYRRDDGTVVDLAPLSERQLKPYRKSIRMIFQDPFSSLNPRMTLADIIGEPLRRSRTGCPHCCAGWGYARSTCAGIRTHSAAASASASVWPAHSPWTRGWWSPMRRSALWTSPSVLRSST